MCTWIVDADQIQLTDFDETLLFRTRTVDSFLDNDNRFGIQGPKGIGKTYLLKCKRMLSQKEGVLCLPQNAMCDILDKVTFDDSMARFMKDYVNWVDLWKAAICISTLKAQAETAEALSDELNKDDDELYFKFYNSIILNTPCQILNALINCDRNSVRNLQKRIPIYVSMLKQIRQPIHIFIDKTDQALRDNLHFITGASKMSRGPSNRSYWAYGQFSLAEAAYQIFVQNPHIKVFFSIRSEALVGAEDYTNLFMQLQSYIVKLEYSPKEIENMFQHYIAKEKDEWLYSPEDRSINSSRAFVGVDSIPHGYVDGSDGKKKVETFFAYLFRHTLKRPRDVMHICYRLCYSSLNEIPDENERIMSIRHIVNHESRLILQSYLREMGPFVFDKHSSYWDVLWSLISTNVFSANYAQEICSIINTSISPDVTCSRDCNHCTLFKPFSLLYNTGLLGYASKNNVREQEHLIKFKSTGEVIIQTDENLLPPAPLYFLHPMLTNKVEFARSSKNKDFNLCNEFIVGDGLALSMDGIAKVRKKTDEKFMKGKTTVFLSSTCYDLHDCRSVIYRTLLDYDYNIIMSESNNFSMPISDINSYDHCLDMVKKCNQLIYIIGGRFGGVYRGERYRDLAEQIRSLNPSLGDPSISLMEFFLAKKRNIPVRVFTKKEIYNERNTYIKNKDSGVFNPAFVEDNRVFEIISTITRLKTGNWLKTYEDLNDLLEIIRIEFGDNSISTFSKE